MKVDVDEVDDNGVDIETPVLPNTPSITETPQQEKRLSSKVIEVRVNQKGISYQNLFADYVRSAKNVNIIDPYIRYPYQVDNLIEFIQMIKENSTVPEGLTITLHTQNDEERIPEMIDIFDEIQDELASYNIEFNYYFDAVHDRSIDLDNGWKILLSRGLDIFEQYSRFSLANAKQENRRCKEFSVTFMQG